MGWTIDKIRALRLRLGWSRAELGRRLGLDLQSIYALEDGSLSLNSELLVALDQLSDAADAAGTRLRLNADAAFHFQNKERTQASAAELEGFAFKKESK